MITVSMDSILLRPTGLLWEAKNRYIYQSREKETKVPRVFRCLGACLMTQRSAPSSHYPKKKKKSLHTSLNLTSQRQSYETHNLSELEQDPCQEASLSLEIMVK